uniref:hypothetical protein n=1 Tax=Candidatus Fimivicinus sp. TaxID=3056640 RepID=UPI003FF13900
MAIVMTKSLKKHYGSEPNMKDEALIAVLCAVCLIVPALVFRATAKESVTERLHHADS